MRKRNISPARSSSSSAALLALIFLLPTLHHLELLHDADGDKRKLRRHLSRTPGSGGKTYVSEKVNSSSSS